ncbi:uncharacterized protein LOC130893701 isoform X1 [Diorhabda carinulata]|uniref:uncharacterized protein LOC130893701 isoform X1 n=1 Tax=Diorhabda carinulata TaxID=1163345 RepID=UPI0025A1314F|nr:uncharacterized protein LOC130893701 isoform X1 [Diorhabda carinulata]
MEVSEVNSDLTETLKSLKCIICGLTLSIPPIMTVSDNEYQCGRCKDIKYADGARRNLIFERVAKFLNFPCVYPNCDALISWKDVENHEKYCQFKTITCPMFQEGCSEQIILSDITSHLVQRHGNNIFFDNIVIPVQMFKHYVCVISVNSCLFFVYICSDKVIVTSVKSSEQTLNYTLKLQNSNENSPIITFKKQPIEEFDERKHCFRCIDNRCDLKYHPYSSSNQSIGVKAFSSCITNPISKDFSFNQSMLSTSLATTMPSPLFATNILKSNSSSNQTQCSTTWSSPSYIEQVNNSRIFQHAKKSETKQIQATTNSGYQPNVCTNERKIKQAIWNTVPSTTFFNSNGLNKPIFSNSTEYLKTSTNTNCKSSDEKSTTTSISSSSSSSIISLASDNIISTANKSQNQKIPDMTNTVNHSFENAKSFETLEDTNLPIIKCTKFNLENIYKLIGITSTIKFTIIIETNEDAANESSLSSDNSFIPRHLLNTIDNSDLLRRTLECPICTEYMVSSIFLCERGHHICSNCKILNNCPSCQGVIKDARNFALEDLAEHVSLCCVFKEKGCRYRGNISNISEHEKNCNYSETNSN